MEVHRALEVAPLFAGATVVHEEMGAVFMQRARALARPVVVGHDIAQRDVVLVHQ